MAEYINNQPAQDTYVGAFTLGPDAKAKSATVTVSGNPALMQFAVGVQGDLRWLDDREFDAPAGPNIINSFKVSNIRGIRFRNAIAGQPALILCTLSSDQDDDPILESGLLSAGSIGANGLVSSAVIIPNVALGSFPPASPQDGQLVSLILPSTFDPVGGKNIRWECEYDATNAVWHVRGVDLYAEVQTAESTATGVYTALATAGPSISLPRPGDYIVTVGSFINPAAAGNLTANMSYDIGGTGAVDADSVEWQSSGGGVGSSMTRSREKTAIAASTTLTSKYKAGGAGATFAFRYMRVTPLRIT